MESLPGIVQMVAIITSFALLSTTRISSCLLWLSV